MANLSTSPGSTTSFHLRPQVTGEGLLSFTIRLGLLVLVIFCLKWGQPLLVPIALAVVLTFVLSPVVTVLQRRGLPRTPAVILVVIVASVLMLIIAVTMGAQFMQLVEELPQYEDSVKKNIAHMREQSQHTPLGKLAGFWESISEAATSPMRDLPRSVNDTAVSVRVVGESDWASLLSLETLQPLTEPLAAAGLVVVFVIFLLINREDAYDRLLCLIGAGRVMLTTKALRDAGERISRYLLAQLLVNIACGVTVGVGLAILQVPHALLWGFFAAILRYVPVVGPWVAAAAPVLLSLMVGQGWFLTAGVVALFLVIELIANLVAEPYFYGQSIGVSQAALLFAIAFWAWLWGPIGLVLAAPLTVCLVVLGKYVPALRFFDVLLGDSPALSPDQAFYQRLVASDELGATRIVQSKSLRTALQTYDEIILPTLQYAKRDFDSGWLNELEFDRLQATLETVLSKHQWEDAEDVAEVNHADSRERLHVLCVAACDEVDQLALELFVPLLNQDLFQVTTTSEAQLVSETVMLVEQEQPTVICIASVPPGGYALTRLLCKRLRKMHPKLKILIGNWAGNVGGGGESQPVFDAGEDVVTTTFDKTLRQLEQYSTYLRKTPPPSQPPLAGEVTLATA